MNPNALRVGLPSVGRGIGSLFHNVLALLSAISNRRSQGNKREMALLQTVDCRSLAVGTLFWKKTAYSDSVSSNIR
jgi:hypothetical protein